MIFGAPEGFEFVAVTDGIITFTDFLGGGGFTITLTDIETTDGEIKYSYCHCNPNFIVKVGDYVQKGQIIGSVGSKYAYGVSGNKYFDITRQANKWSNNRSTFALWNKN